ncbi:MAG TPA: hypothetical protein VF720_10860, partial [Candidatus Eisenbacteria bacterium]
IARILQGEPEWNALPARTPERIRGLLRRCLEKDAKRRLRDIGDARMEIEDVVAVHASSSAITAAAEAGTAAKDSRSLVEWGRLGAVALLALGAGWFLSRATQQQVPAQPIRFTVPEPEGVFLGADGAYIALSPDGRMLAFSVGDSGGTSQMWLRNLESTVATPVAGTEGVPPPYFWSPDSRRIAFGAQEKLKTIAVAGGDPETVCPIKSLRGGSWNRDGVMLLAPYANGAIYRVAAGGGELTAVTAVDTTRGETAHRFPQFLPDGKHFLFSVLPGRDGKIDTYVGSLESPKRQLLLSVASGVTWAPPGHLLYSREDRLIAQGFDLANLKLRGESVSLGDVVNATEYSGGPIATASTTGVVAYGTFQLTGLRLAWTDFDGKELARIPLAPAPWFGGSLSPDDRRAVLARRESANASSIWIADLERGVATRFTDEPGENEQPEWSPDGTRIAHLWSENSAQRIKVRSLAGGVVVTLLEGDPLFKQFYGWTPDGQSLVYARLDPVTQWDLWILPMTGNQEPRPFVNTRFSELQARVAPDGRWLAYNSNESGRVEVYVQSFPVAGGKYQVTNGGGTNFGWSHDGRQLHYGLASDPGIRFAADVLEGPEFRLGPPRRVITAPRDSPGFSRDHTDTRLLAAFPAENDPGRSLTVILGGLPGASKR